MGTCLAEPSIYERLGAGIAFFMLTTREDGADSIGFGGRRWQGYRRRKDTSLPYPFTILPFSTTFRRSVWRSVPTDGENRTTPSGSRIGKDRLSCGRS